MNVKVREVSAREAPRTSGDVMPATWNQAPHVQVTADVVAEAQSVVDAALVIANGYVEREALAFWIAHGKQGNPCLPSTRVEEIMGVVVPAAVAAINGAMERKAKER